METPITLVQQLKKNLRYCLWSWLLYYIHIISNLHNEIISIFFDVPQRAYCRSTDNIVLFNIDEKKKNDSQLGPLSVWVFLGYSGFLPPPRDVHVRWTGMSKWSIGVSEWVCVCVNKPSMEGRSIQGGSHLVPWAAKMGTGHWGLGIIILLVFISVS